MTIGLTSDHRRISPAEQGIAEMMIDLYQNWQSPLSDKELFSWHEMLTNGRRDLQDVGRYRTHSEPMQIVSGSLDEPTIYFEAPPSKAVKSEMKAFITWFNQTGQGAQRELPALIRSGIAHLYFESIHPFEDGNGRIGRALSEKSLSQSLRQPTLIALSHTIQTNKKAYYAALHAASKDLDITEWLVYFCETILEAQRYTQSMIDFLIEKGKFYKRYADVFNDRQAKVIERMFREGVGGFKGGLSAENYISITNAARATATRDLQRLVEQGAFIKTGQLKSTRYYLNIKHESI